MNFPTDYKSIFERVQNINSVVYGRTRNFIDGDVTYLSPYISRGVISLQQIAAHVLKTNKVYQVEKFLQELAWREYWQRVWQNTGDKIFTDIKQFQQDVAHKKMIVAIENAATGIEIIDHHIKRLYQTGYLHNHLRMYLSSIVCNIGKAHWLQPSQWMYYHLLDGDLASNSLSWQWVAGSFSSKKYYCNQENINRYTHTNQINTFLDYPYSELANQQIPAALLAQSNFSPITILPKKETPVLQQGLPVLLYNSYNLDPAWHTGKAANRILLLEPDHFQQFPVSEKVINFITSLAKNIEGMQIFTGTFQELTTIAGNSDIIFKKHPAFTHYTGIAEKYAEMFPEVTGYHSSFFSYWKKCEKYLALFASPTQLSLPKF